jgi:8-oxo-dGTP diphosphatase
VKYVIGFVFDLKNQKVMLIKKNRPASQKGLLNGVGGKVEGPAEDADPVLAMVREAKEESGFESESKDWHLFHNELHISGNDLYFFVTSTEDLASKVKTTTDEVIFLVDYALDWKRNFNRVVGTAQMMYNLNWLLPMAYCYLLYPEHRYTRG